MTRYLRIRIFGEKIYINLEDIADAYAQKLGGSTSTKETNRQKIRDDPQIVIDYINAGNITWSQVKTFMRRRTIEEEAMFGSDEALINGEKIIVED